MRNMQKTLAFFGILAIAGFGQLVGCADDANNCELNYETCPASSSSSSSGVVPPPPGCTDSPAANPEVIRTECAYFVGGSNAKDSNTGGETDPFATLGAALAAAKMQKARVYLCGSVSERVDITAGISVFGGFDCSGQQWQYNAGNRGVISPAAPAADAPFQSSVRIQGSGKTNLEDIDITAENATVDGGSSISVIVDAATVNFARVTLTAGDGKDGLPGITPTDNIGPTSATDPTIVGNDGQDACNGASMGNPGGDAKPNPICGESIGGKGGTGFDLMVAGGGDLGLPMVSGTGTGGIGQDGGSCGPGLGGANGKSGGAGAGGTAIGVIDNIGYTGAAGMPGMKGIIGQGGGGGGGSRGKVNCHGASGGSGGAGGCPGNGGSGGSAGGSSIGIVSIGAALNFSSVSITAGNGGNGGNGGSGQDGAPGGYGGVGGKGAKSPMSTDGACGGGNGGRGGNGGAGGGGRGGHSVGIAYAGTIPPNSGATVQTKTAGNGGVGDGSPASDGTAGMKADSQKFD